MPSLEAEYIKGNNTAFAERQLMFGEDLRLKANQAISHNPGKDVAFEIEAKPKPKPDISAICALSRPQRIELLIPTPSGFQVMRRMQSPSTTNTANEELSDDEEEM